ncbi:MAG: adenosylcobinamide-phosphate synthase CbiB [Desulfuromonadaceae bacterium]|nr:adenosylcobinamide-phosphate synthase CbiB [Desulfuromonadaceae bacterium]MDD5107719.1 adenosylcobinamide-phosphate synthase CbiB [Desulfuromonadaceae bacterium]
MYPDAPTIFLALLLDVIIGDPHWLPHPVTAIGRLIGALDRGLRRNWLNERVAGVILLLLVGIAAGGSVWLLLRVLGVLAPLAGWLAAILISSTCLAARSLHRESARVADAVAVGDLPAARRYLSYIVGRDTDQLDEPEIWRAVVETVAENTSDGIIAPLFWLTLTGPVGAMVFKAVSTLDSMVGYKNPRYLRIGWASARADDLLNFVPARITALLLVMAAPLISRSVSKAARIALRDCQKHPSPNSGHPEAAAAGVLGVRLGGPASYGGVSSFKEYLGDPLEPVDGCTYRTMIVLMYISTLLMAAMCIAAVTCLRGFRVPFA